MVNFMLHVFHHNLKKKLGTQPVHSYQGISHQQCTQQNGPTSQQNTLIREHLLAI